jgi:dolichyl-phosphate-mannose--protein O-mannosyl transferase
MFYCVLGIYVGLRWFRRLNEEAEGKAPMSRRQHMVWAVGVGLAMGASISVKWTGLATPGMIGLECLFALWFLKRRPPVLDMAVAAVVAVSLYHLTFWLHFWALSMYTAEANDTSLGYRRTLKGSPDYDPQASAPWFLPVMWKLNKDMLFGSASISTPHTWESKYYQWVLNLRGLMYYGEPFGPQPGLWCVRNCARPFHAHTLFLSLSIPFCRFHLQARIGRARVCVLDTPPSRSAMYLIGNPIVIWGCAAAVAFFLVLALVLTPVHLVAKSVSDNMRWCLRVCR